MAHIGMGASIALLGLLTSACGSSHAPERLLDAGEAVSPDAGIDAGHDLGGEPERCNGLDDDLDGARDEGCPLRLTDSDQDDVMPRIAAGNVFFIRRDPVFGGAGQLLRTAPGEDEVLVVEDAVVFDVDRDHLVYLGADGVHRVIDWRSTEVLRAIEPQEDGILRARISADLVVWYERVTGTEENYDVFSMSLSTGAIIRRTEHPAIQQHPMVEDGTVVWLDDRHGHHTRYLLHFFELFRSDGPDGVARVTTRPDDWTKGYPVAFDRGRLLLNEEFAPWEDWAEPRPCSTVLYDAQTGERRAIFEDASPCYQPWDLDADRVVLELDPEGASDLVLFDLGRERSYQVTDYARRSSQGRIEGDLLVWADDRNDRWDLYTMNLQDLEEGDFFPEGRRP